MATFQQTSLRVNLEFLRAAGSGRVGRIIRFNHTPAIVPAQLQGRLSPSDWAAFMAEMDILAKNHPYLAKPNAKQVGTWAACFAIGAAVGLCIVDPDPGDYVQWESQAQAALQKFRPVFDKAGCVISLQKRRDYWVQIDIDPNRGPAMPIAVGIPPPQIVPGQTLLSPFQTVAP